MNILITGANGQLGNEMRVLSAAHPQHTYFFTDVQELDICDADAVRAFIADRRVDVVVNCRPSGGCGRELRRLHGRGQGRGQS